MVGRLSDLLPELGRPGNGAVPFAMRSNGYRLIWLDPGNGHHCGRSPAACCSCSRDSMVLIRRSNRTVTPADGEHATTQSTGRGPRRRSRHRLFPAGWTVERVQRRAATELLLYKKVPWFHSATAECSMIQLIRVAVVESDGPDRAKPYESRRGLGRMRDSRCNRLRRVGFHWNGKSSREPFCRGA